MRIKRKVKIKFPFKIRPRLCMVVRVEEKPQKERNDVIVKEKDENKIKEESD